MQAPSKLHTDSVDFSGLLDDCVEMLVTFLDFLFSSWKMRFPHGRLELQAVTVLEAFGLLPFLYFLPVQFEAKQHPRGASFIPLYFLLILIIFY